MANSLIKVAEIVVEKLQASGAPIAVPEAKDIMLISYGQDMTLEDVITDGERIETLGPDGVVCALKKDDEFTGATLSGNLAKWPKKLKYLLMGGTYVNATDTWTPPMSGTISVAPVKVTCYSELYADGENTETDILGYEKLILPKCKGKLGALALSNTAFTGGPLTLNAKDYIATDPAQSKPPYYFDTMAATLPSAASYTQTFHAEKAADNADLAGVVITFSDSAVTDTTDVSGDASVSLPYGVYTYTATLTGYVTQTGTVTVGLVNDEIKLSMVAS